MAGAPSFGKMSTFICRMAMIDVRATARTATRIVIGRRMAVKTNHMSSLPQRSGGRLRGSRYDESRRSQAKAKSRTLRTELRTTPSRPELFQKRRQIAMRLSRREQRAPHTEPRHRIVGFGLREQP